MQTRNERIVHQQRDGLIFYNLRSHTCMNSNENKTIESDEVNENMLKIHFR